jgi:hypothetical protein
VWENFRERIIRAAKLDTTLYEEVEADKEAMKQAVGVVLLSSFAAGFGSVGRGGGISGIILGAIAALIGWYVWAYLVYLIGTKLLPEPQTSSTPQELLRTIGFSSSPGLIRVFGVIPPLTSFVFLVASIWMLVAMVIAVRQALDYTKITRAIAVCVIGWIVQVLLCMILLYILGPPSPK